MADFLSTMFSGGAEREAADKDRAAAALYQSQVLPALQAGYTTGTGNLGQAIGAYQPLATLGSQLGAGVPTLMGALGVGTPEQVAASRSAFSASPGYQFSLDQAQQAAERGMAAGGTAGLGSGNLLDALQRNAVNLSDQEYQNWIKNLTQTGQMGIGATAGAAQGIGQGYTNLANLAQTYAQNQAGVYGNVAQTDIGANNLQAAGEAAGAKNLLGAGLSLATLAMNPASGMSSMLGKLAGGFGGGQSGALNVGGYAMPTVGYNPMA